MTQMAKADTVTQDAALKDRAIIQGVVKAMPKDLTQSKPGGTSDPAPRGNPGDGSSGGRGDRQGSTGKAGPSLSKVVSRPNRPPSFRK